MLGEATAHRIWGQALMAQGPAYYDEAETHLENARKLDGKNERALQALERLRKKKG